MPANSTYYHIFNDSIEGRNLFNDNEDYKVFQGFINEYLSPLSEVGSEKKTFTIRGRQFKGTPHQPKNHFGKVKLVALDLKPTRYNLLLRQESPGYIERFMRSLGTRYSIYYNKKYQRTGSLFAGPYKSEQIENFDSSYSSYTEYLNTKSPAPEPKTELLERIDLQSQPVAKKPHARVPEIIGLSAMFIILFGLGMRNIKVTETKKALANSAPVATSEPIVLSESTDLSTLPPTDILPSPEATVIPTPSPSTLPKMVEIETGDSISPVNVRKEPSLSSEIVNFAYDGDTFELISHLNEWYEIKLSDSTIGFVSEKYIK